MRKSLVVARGSFGCIFLKNPLREKKDKRGVATAIVAVAPTENGKRKKKKKENRQTRNVPGARKNDGRSCRALLLYITNSVPARRKQFLACWGKIQLYCR